MSNAILSISQNFIKSRRVVVELVKQSGIGPEDTVFDIGAGKGIISEELSMVAKKVYAIEVDPKLVIILKDKFENSNVEVIDIDFLKYDLPWEKYKVFSNIPFNHTADIVKKLFNTYPSFDTGYLILQNEAAIKFAGDQVGYKNSMLSIVYGVRYEMNIAYHFRPIDFEPIPKVGIVLLRIAKRSKELVPTEEYKAFKDFVAYIFNKSVPNISSCRDLFTSIQFTKFEQIIGVSKYMKPTEISLKQFVYMFNVLKVSDKLRFTTFAYTRLKNEQTSIQKVNRTRAVGKGEKNERIKGGKEIGHGKLGHGIGSKMHGAKNLGGIAKTTETKKKWYK